MKKYDLLSISPIDGRYFEICHGMAELFSEYALIKNRVLVEVKWLIFLSDLKERTGIDVIRVEIRRINFLRDTANLRIFYYEEDSE